MCCSERFLGCTWDHLGTIFSRCRLKFIVFLKAPLQRLITNWVRSTWTKHHLLSFLVLSLQPSNPSQVLGDLWALSMNIYQEFSFFLFIFTLLFNSGWTLCTLILYTSTGYLKSEYSLLHSRNWIDCFNLLPVLDVMNHRHQLTFALRVILKKKINCYKVNSPIFFFNMYK